MARKPKSKTVVAPAHDGASGAAGAMKHSNLPPQLIRDREHWVPDIETALGAIETGLRRELEDLGIKDAAAIPAQRLEMACQDRIAKLTRHHRKSRKWPDGRWQKGYWQTKARPSTHDRLRQLQDAASMLHYCREALKHDNPWLLAVAISEVLKFWLYPLAMKGAKQRHRADKASETLTTADRDHRLAARGREIAMDKPALKPYEIIDRLLREFSGHFTKKDTLRSALRRGRKLL
jgi:hypothetical protein